MKKTFSNTGLILFMLVLSLEISAQGYNIKIKIPALKDSTILLAHHFSSEKLLIPDDTLKLDKKGMGTFHKKKVLPGGMYLIFLPSKKYFDVLIDKNQQFSIEADTTDFLKTVKFTNNPENHLFYEYQNLIAGKSQEVHKLMELKKTAETESRKDSVTKVVELINKEVTTYIKGIITGHSDMFLAVILKGLQEIEVPEPPKDAKGNIIDSSFQYRYYRKHYFDNFDLHDTRLLHTLFYEQKVKNYIDNVVPQIPDTLNLETDMLIEKVRDNKELFQNMLVMLFNSYASSQIMGMDAVFVHIAEKYYIPYASWSDKDYIEKLKKEVAKKKPNLIGKTAPDIALIQLPTDHFLVAKTDTALKSNPYVGDKLNLLDVKAKFLVIAFWEADCGHCKKSMPVLYDAFQKLKDKDVKVLAIHMISSVEGKRKWIDFINERSMYDWINVWSPYSYEYKDLYNVYTTPVIYILDENKKIIAKQIAADQVEQVINFEINKKQSGKLAVQ